MRLRRMPKRKLRRYRFRVGYLPQDAASMLPPILTVGENVAEPILERDHQFDRPRARDTRRHADRRGATAARHDRALSRTSSAGASASGSRSPGRSSSSRRCSSPTSPTTGIDVRCAAPSLSSSANCSEQRASPRSSISHDLPVLRSMPTASRCCRAELVGYRHDRRGVRTTRTTRTSRPLPGRSTTAMRSSTTSCPTRRHDAGRAPRIPAPCRRRSPGRAARPTARSSPARSPSCRTPKPVVADAARAAGASVAPLHAEHPRDDLAGVIGSDELRAVLDAHPAMSGCSCRGRASTRSRAARTSSVDDCRVWTSAKGAYSEPVAEHALTLALALAAVLPREVRATDLGGR